MIISIIQTHLPYNNGNHNEWVANTSANTSFAQYNVTFDRDEENEDRAYESESM